MWFPCAWRLSCVKMIVCVVGRVVCLLLLVGKEMVLQLAFLLKEIQNKDKSRGRLIGTTTKATKSCATLFQLIGDLVHTRLIFESHETTAVSPVIFSLAVCFIDIMNKACMCGTSVYYITRQPFCALHWTRMKQHGCILRNSNSKQKSKSQK